MSDIQIIVSEETVIQVTLEANPFVVGGATQFLELQDAPDSYEGQAGNAVVVKADESGLEFIPASGTGDMTKAVYDPDNVSADMFDTDNHVNGTTNRVFTAVEQVKLSSLPNISVGTVEPTDPSVGDLWVDTN